MIWFTSDWHLGHKNVLEYDSRPFSSIEEHDQRIIDNFNDMVEDNDEVYYLGDFCLGSIKHAEECMKQLNGHLHFIRGNHDKKDTVALYQKYGTYLGEQATVQIQKQKIVLNHCRMYVWFGSHHGSWNIHGHSHGSLNSIQWGKSLDVSINVTGYKPISFSALKAYMEEIPPHLSDGHKER